MLQTGEHIADRFEIESLLGEGGLAQVYRVRHLNLGTAHALKLLTLTHSGTVERLLQEGRIQAQLRHPNIVAVTDIVMHRGQPGLLMEFVEGESLEAALTRDGPPPLNEALDLFAQVLAGVAAAHAAGVLHRDLKPANILLARTSNGVVPKVTDFGIAKVARGGTGGGTPLTRLGVTMGTPGYMAPEQSEDASTVDARADVFALGAILYELVTGQRAFPSASVRDTLNAAASGDYVAPERLVPNLRENVGVAIRVALQPAPEDRYADCLTFAAAIFGDQPDQMARLMPSRGTPPPLPAFLWPRATPPAAPSLTTDEELVRARAETGTLNVGGAGAGTPPQARPTLPHVQLRPWMIGVAILLMLLGMAGAVKLLSTLRAPPPEPVANAPAVAAPAPVEAAAPATEASPDPAPESVEKTPVKIAKSTSATSNASGSGTKATTSASAASDPAGEEPRSGETQLAEDSPVPTSGTGGTEAPVEAAATVVPDFKGAWVGDPWNLTILTQEDLRVSGFIYRGAAGSRLPVSGAYNPETRTLVVRDGSTSRYVLSATVHGDRLTGTYTQGEGDLSSRWSAKRSR